MIDWVWPRRGGRPGYFVLGPGPGGKDVVPPDLPVIYGLPGGFLGRRESPMDPPQEHVCVFMEVVLLVGEAHGTDIGFERGS